MSSPSLGLLITAEIPLTRRLRGLSFRARLTSFASPADGIALALFDVQILAALTPDKVMRCRLIRFRRFTPRFPFGSASIT